MVSFNAIHKGVKLFPIDLHRPVQAGSFEFTLCHRLDRKLHLAIKLKMGDLVFDVFRAGEN